MSLEVVRDPQGRVTSASAGMLNPSGRNQWTKRGQTQHVLDCAVQRHLSEKPECADSYGEKVAYAIGHIDEPGQLEIVKHALGPGVLERAAASSDGEPTERDAPSSDAQLTDLASEFGASRPRRLGPDSVDQRPGDHSGAD